MKKLIFVLLALQMTFLLGCSAHYVDNDFNKSIEDIKSIQPYSTTDTKKNNEIELKYANIYRKISTDTSTDAMRTIGKIQDTNISAKELELGALKLQLSGSQKIYSEAWDELRISFLENTLAEKYNINCKSDATKLVEQNKRYFAEIDDDTIAKYLKELYKAYGMSENEYWDEYAYKLYLKQICHERVVKYLQDNHLPEMKPDQVQGEITDEIYLEKINSEQTKI